jgi:release factor glutamine methyltransferase
VADIGTGSGVIAISVAKHAPECRVIAADINPQALAVARENAEQHQVADRMEFLVSDLFEAFPADGHFDVIASNPPYIAEEEIAALSPDVRQYEPRSALVAGRDGSEILARLVADATRRLVPGGSLIVEISPMLEHRARALFSADSRWSDVTVTKDLAGLPRVVKANFVP